MKRAHIPPTDIAQKSGHRNIQSINQYGDINEIDQEAMGIVLRETSRNVPMEYEHATSIVRGSVTENAKQSLSFHSAVSSSMGSSNAISLNSRSSTSVSSNATVQNQIFDQLQGASHIFTHANISGSVFNITINN